MPPQPAAMTWNDTCASPLLGCERRGGSATRCRYLGGPMIRRPSAVLLVGRLALSARQAGQAERRTAVAERLPCILHLVTRSAAPRASVRRRAALAARSRLTRLAPPLGRNFGVGDRYHVARW